MKKTTDFSGFKKKFVSNLSWQLPECAIQAEALLSDLANSLAKNRYVDSAALFQISFGSIRSALTLANAGAVGAIPSVLRHSLEATLYAFLFVKNSEFHDLWWRRHDDPEAKGRFARKGLKTAHAELKTVSKSINEKTEACYQSLIDFGAHPNIRQYLGISNYVEFDSGRSGEPLEVSILASEHQRNLAIVMVVQVSISLAEIYYLIWPERYIQKVDGRRYLELIGQLKVFSNYAYSDEEFDSSR